MSHPILKRGRTFCTRDLKHFNKVHTSLSAFPKYDITPLILQFYTGILSPIVLSNQDSASDLSDGNEMFESIPAKNTRRTLREQDSSSNSSDCSESIESIPAKSNRRMAKRLSCSQRDMDAAVIVTSIKTSNPKCDEDAEINKPIDDDDSFDIDGLRKEIMENLTEDENGILDKRSSITKVRKKRKDISFVDDKQKDESPAHLTRNKAKAAGIIVDKDGNKRKKKSTESTWI